MGKAAENEQIKFRATFLNNIAVGLIVAGVFLPVFALFFRLQETVEMIAALVNGRATPDETAVSVAAVVSVITAFWGAWYLRRRVIKELEKIQD
jgi:hypothetical protein